MDAANAAFPRPSPEFRGGGLTSLGCVAARNIGSMQGPDPPANSLIGRASELAELERRLNSSRLVTVIGPGGVGKTALARGVVDAVGTTFRLGVHLIDLTRVTSADVAAGSAAAQLGFDSFEAMLAAPRDERSLLILDNCEHLLDAAAHLVEQILDASRLTSVLATSRSPLDLPGESLMTLAPLRVGGAEPDDDPGASPAVQLFLTRARDAGIVIADERLGLVAELCRRLDGLPLAIELAAARARTMSIEDIAARAGEGLAVLDRPRFRGPARHRSLTETIGWSYDLLPDSAADLMDRLAVFAGPFTAADAQRVACFGLDADRFGNLLDELVNVALVTPQVTQSVTRYRLLETVRAFALDQLDRKGTRAEATARFVDHALALARETFIMGSSSWDDLLRHLVDSFDTVTEALRWCVEHDEHPEQAMTLCATLWPAGRFTETVGLARRVFERWPDSDVSTTADATVTLAYGEYADGHPQIAAELAEGALGRLTTPRLASVTLRRVLGHARVELGDVRGAITAFTEGAVIARELGSMEAAFDLSVSAGELAAYLGNLDDALRAVDLVRREAVEWGSRTNAAAASASLAWLLVNRDGLDALAAVTQALEDAQKAAHHGAVITNLRSMVHAQLMAGDVAAAHGALVEWFASGHAWGTGSDARDIVGAAALVAFHAGHPSWDVLAASCRERPTPPLPAELGGSLLPVPDSTAQPASPRDQPGVVRASMAAVRELIAGTASDRVSYRPALADRVASPSRASLRQAGVVWAIDFDGQSIMVRAGKGIDDLAQLLAAAGREIHCLDLMGAVAEQSSTGEVIDTAARRRYEDRIRELQQVVDEAEAANDYIRAERAQVELDAVVHHLTRALGHGGKTRRGGDSAERARSAVAQRVRSAIRQIEELHPALGRHLRSSIKTGFYCSYQPERPTVWEVVIVSP
jgi:predicted ATPase